MTAKILMRQVANDEFVGRPRHSLTRELLASRMDFVVAAHDYRAGSAAARMLPVRAGREGVERQDGSVRSPRFGALDISILFKYGLS